MQEAAPLAEKASASQVVSADGLHHDDQTKKKDHFKRSTKHERHVGIDTKNMRTMNMNMLLTYLLTSLLTY